MKISIDWAIDGKNFYKYWKPVWLNCITYGLDLEYNQYKAYKIYR